MRKEVAPSLKRAVAVVVVAAVAVASTTTRNALQFVEVIVRKGSVFVLVEAVVVAVVIRVAAMAGAAMMKFGHHFQQHQHRDNKEWQDGEADVDEDADDPIPQVQVPKKLCCLLFLDHRHDDLLDSRNG